MLVVEGLVKRFGGFTAVNKVSFRVEQGEILGLIGPNGSGKSTIFNMLSGTLVPTSGSIEFDGAEIAGTAPHRIINRGIGRTFQIPRPFHRLTMFENVALAGYFGQGRRSRSKAEEAAERALAMVGLSTDRTAQVDGLGAAGLKKLELAKALATGPKLLLASRHGAGHLMAAFLHAWKQIEHEREPLGITGPRLGHEGAHLEIVFYRQAGKQPAVFRYVRDAETDDAMLRRLQDVDALH